MLHPAILCRAGPGAGFSTIHKIGVIYDLFFGSSSAT